jgi:hypothetical protein
VCDLCVLFFNYPLEGKVDVGWLLLLGYLGFFWLLVMEMEWLLSAADTSTLRQGLLPCFNGSSLNVADTSCINASPFLFTIYL